MPKKKRKRTQVGRSAAPKKRAGRLEAGDSEFDVAPTSEKILRGRDNLDRAPDDPSASELAGDTAIGRVTSIRGADAVVEPEGGGEAVVCRLRKSTRVPHPKTNALAIGDFVTYLIEETQPFALTEVRVRTTQLSRIRRGRDPHVIAANVDMGVMVASASDPPFKPRLVDRYLLAMQDGGLDPVVVVNKLDLVSDAAVVEMLAPYATIDVVALAVSAETGVGMDALIDVLRDRTSVFSGQSGVGKTSLLNRLLSDADLRTSHVHQRTGKGRHTTSASTLYRLPFGGAVVDTPGVRAFQMHEPTMEALAAFFPEIAEVAEECKFSDCRHRGDHGCALPDAIARGQVREERLESFQILAEEIRET